MKNKRYFVSLVLSALGSITLIILIDSLPPTQYLLGITAILCCLAAQGFKTLRVGNKWIGLEGQSCLDDYVRSRESTIERREEFWKNAFYRKMDSELYIIGKLEEFESTTMYQSFITSILEKNKFPEAGRQMVEEGWKAAIKAAKGYHNQNANIKPRQ